MNNDKDIRAYHQRTKHRLDGYARGPEYLDWNDQPNSFRRFSGARLQRLPLLPDTQKGTAKLDIEGISRLMELSFGLSAWKVFGPDRWSLRCNPSSGNLHPSEAYLVCHDVAGLDDGVYHYAPHEHGLEQRADFAVDGQSPYCLLGLSSVLWREAWKYGERAYRYTQLDIGHALGALRYAAAVIGWRYRLLLVGDMAIGELLGLSRTDDYHDAEEEYPDVLVQLLPPGEATGVVMPTPVNWRGTANRLGGEPRMRWPVAEQAHAASLCGGDAMSIANPSKIRPSHPPGNLAGLIRQRRSAQSFVGTQSQLALPHFEQMLRALLPSPAELPWDAWSLPVQLHLLFFIHRVEGIDPGIYALPRHTRGRTLLQDTLADTFAWENVPAISDDIPLYQLEIGDSRKIARMLGCHQEIAAAGSFCLSMLAEFDQALASAPCGYRHLHWEAGLAGQVLYLQAEDVGMRGTGIGCFFDDGVHRALGIQDTTLQSVYHFTVGKPRLDPRLQTLPPYQHLEAAHDD